MRRAGLLLLAATFTVVALVLVGQVVDARVRPVPGLYYLFAACDPPATLGAWLAFLGARAVRERRLFLVAALSLSIVGVVVLGDLALSRVAPGAAVTRVLGAKAAWLAADVATVAAMGALALASGAASPARSRLIDALIAAALIARAAAGVAGALGPVPWPLRLSEALLYALVAWRCLGAVGRTSLSGERARATFDP